MSFAALKQHAAAMPGATMDIKWGADWVASVGGKMFLVGGHEPGPWTSCSFKVDEHRFLELSDLPGFAPAPYMARHRWVQLSDPRALPLADLKALVERSYQLVRAGLSKKLQASLDAGA
ncbi:MmcQ/YjbR family DNA-binding protein [Roseateles violae]|uniref:MmcQ/YjbR family DNA-binding protein n=1 Tax=Roseateles violae TaxID=3058042 RepID=A0ABT8DZZ1_9BURK|nr:MmcQ/YjbR family DNA-binding protein [Pelomonas sp. PFR6]MDN3923119.1 MmcQ/YjbR family DNA-binding protein [Pelomonas sp. PFR6]